MADVLRLPLLITPSRDLVEGALHLAVQTGRTVYDCLYLALAIRGKSVMVSEDRRFVNALKETPLVKHIAWIGASS